tara:strand:+ start:314 stop:814 length:501 start_codon:yes stop_codon:yes gene_type:complete
MKYFLIGFMGSGKSTLGKKLSKELNLRYIDLDKYIEKYENKDIATIFKIHGEKGFRNLEKKYLIEILRKDNILISTGGGTPIFNNLMQIMNDSGTTIYLKCSTKTLFKRLENDMKRRPLISSLTKEKLSEYIRTNLKKREELYKESQYTIDNNDEIDVEYITSKLR